MDLREHVCEVHMKQMMNGYIVFTPQYVYVIQFQPNMNTLHIHSITIGLTVFIKDKVMHAVSMKYVVPFRNIATGIEPEIYFSLAAWCCGERTTTLE